MEKQHRPWTREQVAQLYRTPLLALMHQSAEMHRRHHDPCQIQVCTLLSIKTGGCPEDCGYCSQSAHYETGLQRQPLLETGAVVEAAARAKEAGSTRFCMGAAWRQAREGEEFDQVLEMVRQVSSLGLEVCCTLGMLSQEQALRLKEAGLYAYNHNLDTGPGFYDRVVSTRTYEDRLQTLTHVAQVGLSVCCGGILGLGESEEDRIDLLHTLASLPTPPESVPVNALVPVPGTPLGQQPRVSVWEVVRMIAAARILFPRAMVRLSAGRDQLSDEAQALCFLAGANSIFSGDKLLTTPHPGLAKDAELFALLGLEPKVPYEETSAATTSAMQR